MGLVVDRMIRRTCARACLNTHNTTKTPRTYARTRDQHVEVLAGGKDGAGRALENCPGPEHPAAAQRVGVRGHE